MTALDLQLDPAHPSLQLHKLEKARDMQFCSVRVNSDVPVIVHRIGRVAGDTPGFPTLEGRGRQPGVSPISVVVDDSRGKEAYGGKLNVLEACPESGWLRAG
jgi:hypothetical protein